MFFILLGFEIPTQFHMLFHMLFFNFFSFVVELRISQYFYPGINFLLVLCPAKEMVNKL